MFTSRVVLGLVLAGQVACMRTLAIRERPTDYLVANNPSSVWITSADGQPVEVVGPRVVGSNVAGWSEGARVSIPVEQVREVKVRKLDALRSSLVTGGVLGAGTAVIIYLLTKPKAPTGCEYFNGMPAEESAETGTLGICSIGTTG